MSSLYAIQKDFEILTSKIIENDGELTTELETELIFNDDQLEKKAFNIAAVDRNMSASIDMLDNEIKRLQKRKKRLQKSLDTLKERLADAMLERGIEKLENDLFTISFRKSERLIIEDERLIPEDYLVTKVSPDKRKIKNALKDNDVIFGARIEERQNIQIK